MKQSPKNKTHKLQQERQELLDELHGFSLLIRGSFFERFSICSRKSCACHKGKRHGPRAYVAVTGKKVQRQHYIPQNQIKSVREGIEQFGRLREITDRITAINLELMKEGTLHEKF